MTNIAVAHYGACEPINAVIPWMAWPEKTTGVEKLVTTLAAQYAGNAIEISFEGLGVHSTGTAALIAALFIDDEQFARKVWMPNPFAANFLTAIGGSFIYMPGDVDTHTFRIRLGSAAGVVWFNGTTGGLVAGGASVCTLTVKELK